MEMKMWKYWLWAIFTMILIVGFLGYIGYQEYTKMKIQLVTEGAKLCDDAYQQGIRNSLETNGFIVVQYGNERIKLVPENAKS